MKPLEILLRVLGILMIVSSFIVFLPYFTYAACGFEGQNCCVGPQGNRFCTQPGTECRDGRCVRPPPCGGQNEACCPGPVPCKPNVPLLGCVNGKCQPVCGLPGLPCCTSGPRCMPGFECNQSNQCWKPCGLLGLPCCDNRTCGPNLECGSDNKCNLRCGLVGASCCDNQRCDAGLECFQGKCYVPLNEGAPCIAGSPPPCKSPNLECINRKCTVVGVEGKPCKQGGVCTDGSVCYRGYCERQGELNKPCAAGNTCQSGLVCAFHYIQHESGDKTIGVCKYPHMVGGIQQLCRIASPQCNPGLACQSGNLWGYCYKPCTENCSLRNTKTEIWYCDRWNTGTCKRSSGGEGEPCLPTEPPSCQYGLRCSGAVCIIPGKGTPLFTP